MRFFSKSENRVAPLNVTKLNDLKAPKVNNLMENDAASSEKLITRYAILRGDATILVESAFSKDAKGFLPELYDNAKAAFTAARKQYPGLALTLFEIQISPNEAKQEHKNVLRFLMQNSNQVTSYSQSNNKFENGKVEYQAEIEKPQPTSFRKK